MSGSPNAPAGCASGELGGSMFQPRSAGQPDARTVNPPAAQRQLAVIANGWPLSSYLELGAYPGAVPCARVHAQQLLWEWGLVDVSDDVELLVSELTTNAVWASQSLEQTLPIGLWLLSDRQRIVVSVWDSNPRPPVRADAPEDAESGRGLLLVEAISERWGWYPPRDIGGKCVWCEVAYPES